jgi:molybdopterin synthase catalytic subunit
VPLGAVSLAIVVAAPHRAQAFEACRYIIEALKQRVPIWKRELLEDGTATWVDPTGHPTAVGPA